MRSAIPMGSIRCKKGIDTICMYVIIQPNNASGGDLAAVKDLDTCIGVVLNGMAILS